MVRDQGRESPGHAPAACPVTRSENARNLTGRVAQHVPLIGRSMVARCIPGMLIVLKPKSAATKGDGETVALGR
jgi:hypothetical protein